MNMEETVAFSIEAGYGDLRASEKKAADYILKHLQQVREMSLEELAEECRVSQPTIMRMLKSLGYKGFRHFKYVVVEELAKEQDEHTSALYLSLIHILNRISIKKFRSFSLHSFCNAAISLFNSSRSAFSLLTIRCV